MQVRVLSYNIKGHGSFLRPAHIERIASVIRDARPDIAGLQEVHRGGWRARSQDQIAELERRTGMTTLFGRSMGDTRSEFGNVVLTRGRIVESQIHPLPGKGEPRTLFSTLIELDGQELRFFVTHLAAWGRFGARERQPQAEMVAEIVSRSDRPFVLCGDFNAGPGSSDLAVLHGSSQFTTCFPETVITHRSTRQSLDAIFVSPGWTTEKAAVLQTGPSDHWPLLAELTRKQ